RHRPRARLALAARGRRALSRLLESDPLAAPPRVGRAAGVPAQLVADVPRGQRALRVRPAAAPRRRALGARLPPDAAPAPPAPAPPGRVDRVLPPHAVPVLGAVGAAA